MNTFAAQPAYPPRRLLFSPMSTQISSLPLHSRTRNRVVKPPISSLFCESTRSNSAPSLDGAETVWLISWSRSCAKRVLPMLLHYNRPC